VNIRLNYTDEEKHPITAAYLQGNDPGNWIREIARLKIPLEQVSCFIVPEGIHSRKPVGLLVVFHAKPGCNKLDIALPYRCIENKLFLPLNAFLFPEVAADELKGLLLYNTMLFHPHIGLVGFEDTERLSVEELLEIKPAKYSLWKAPINSEPLFPVLNRIRVNQPHADQMLEALQENVSSKPLEDIKEEGKRNAFEKLMDKISLKGLKVIRAILSRFSKRDSKENNPNNTKDASTKSTFNKWVNEKIADLEKRREDELKRLLSMFEENMDEALQYAIPLSSSYLNRGEAPKSASLSKQDINFNWKFLGGGGKADVWDVGNYYHELRNKYLKAAAKELANKNFKRAAYIYAHLLNDFHSAALALKSGGMYREAALLYKDHLKNESAAAECLEQGGLYTEAIEVYQKLERYEKVGDLYTLLNQKQKADEFYERCVKSALKDNDYLEASRIQQEKKKEYEKATDTLLQGWTHSWQKENCLVRYFDRLAENPELNLIPYVQSVYYYKTPKHQRSSFLNVISQLADKTKDKELRNATKEMAYVIVSEQLQKGHAENLHKLKHFIPEDKFALQDFSRYTSSSKSIQRFKRNALRIALEQTTAWFKLIETNEGFIAFGRKENSLHLVRGNWTGQLEYHSMESIKLQEGINWQFIYDPYFMNTIFVIAPSHYRGVRKDLERNSNFSRPLTIDFPDWIPDQMIGAVITSPTNLTFLCKDQRNASLHNYNTRGELISIQDYKFKDEQFSLSSYDKYVNLIYRDDRIYFSLGDFLCEIKVNKLFRSEQLDSVIETTDEESFIHSLCAPEHNSPFKLIVSTDTSAYLYSGTPEKKIKKGDFYTTEEETFTINYLPDNKLILTDAETIGIYAIKNNVPQLLYTLELNDVIFSLIPAKRNTFAYLTGEGTILIQSINE
jgi:hypothetical protein